MSKLVALHGHTLLSDGTLTHQEYLKLAGENNIGVVGFTEHDTVPDSKVLAELDNLRNDPVKWTIGIEMTSDLPKELGSGTRSLFHVLGYFIDPTNPDLIEYCNERQKQRIDSALAHIKHLTSLGFDITLEDVRAQVTGNSMGKPHLVSALKSKPQNLSLMAEYLEKVRQQAQTDERIKESFDNMMTQGEDQYPYALFVTENAFFANPNPTNILYPDFDTVVKVIRDAGGIAMIAHYSTVVKEIPYEFLGKLMKEDRIDGMETIFGAWTIGTSEESQNNENQQKVKELLEKYNLLAGGGGDFHYTEDFAKYDQDRNYSGSSIGMAEKLKQRYPKTSRWTTF